MSLATVLSSDDIVQKYLINSQNKFYSDNHKDGNTFFMFVSYCWNFYVLLSVVRLLIILGRNNLFSIKTAIKSNHSVIFNMFRWSVAYTGHLFRELLISLIVVEKKHFVCCCQWNIYLHVWRIYSFAMPKRYFSLTCVSYK